MTYHYTYTNLLLLYYLKINNQRIGYYSSQPLRQHIYNHESRKKHNYYYYNYESRKKHNYYYSHESRKKHNYLLKHSIREYFY